jgi:hypothetical protein
MHLPQKIYPVQPPQTKDENQENEYVINDTYYNSDSFFPDTICSIEEIKEIRGRRFAIIQIAPVQYNPSIGSLHILKSCEFTINLLGSDLTKTKKVIRRYSSESFEVLYESLFLNYGYYEILAGNTNEQEGYLIIVDDQFYDEIIPLSNWKTSLGFDTNTTKTSEISGGPTASNIKNYIQNAYNTWAIPPAYVLLVGDTPQIPAFTGTECGTETDSYYGTMDGDIFPDIFISRFPASTETHVVTMVNKTIYYEQGNFPSNEWIKKGAFIASSDHGQLAEATHEYVMTTHLEPNNYTCDRIYQSQGGNTNDISTAVNNGTTLCIYSGHGSPSGWACVPFYQSNVNALTNEGLYPFVCSHACSTNTYEDSECFGETWLRVENKGGLAFWGSSCSTYWDEDDVIERRVFDAWWYDGMERIGQMTDKGMYDAYMQNPGLQIEKFMESYNVMGDSSVIIWSDDPFTPEHDIELQNINIEDIIPHGETQNVSAVVRNIGNNTENGIIVNFIENEVVMDSTTIQTLHSMQETIVSFNWNPVIGTHIVEIESQPIQDEYDLLNNNVNKSVNVVASPVISVDPISLTFMVPTNDTDTQQLTIFNLPNAEAILNYSITFRGDFNGTWLSAQPSQGLIPIGQSNNISIIINTTDFTEGSYQGDVIIGSNDVNDPEIYIPIALLVVFGNDFAAIRINTPPSLISHGHHIVNATIQNMGHYNQTNIDINCSIFEGFLNYTENFELNDGGYIAGGTPDWEWGIPTIGPTSPHSGSYCWATDLDGDYGNDGSATMDSVEIFIPHGVSSNLSFWQWYDIENGVNHYDGGNVKISTDGGTYWQILGEYLNPYPIQYAADTNEGIPHEPCFSGISAGWEYVSFDLSAFAGETVKFRWHFGSDGSITEPGWYIDDIKVHGTDWGNNSNLEYYSTQSINILAYETQDVEFFPEWNASQNGFIEVFNDVRPPVVSSIFDYPDPQIVDGFVNISCHVVDETIVDSVFIDVMGPLGFIPVNVSMTPMNDSEHFYYNMNYSIIGNYSYQIFTNDTSGNGIEYSGFGFEIVNDSYISVDMGFEVGWNLITTPVETGWYASDLADNITGSLSVSRWDSGNQTYRTYIVGGPPVFDFLIEDGCGYFVDTTSSSVCIMIGLPLFSVNVPLKVGWNLLGWYHEYDTTASSLAANITGCLSVSMWDSVNQTYNTFIVGGPPVFDFDINCGMGIFIDVTVESIWLGVG